MCTCGLIYALLACPALPDDPEKRDRTPSPVVLLEAPRTFRLRIGMRLHAADGAIQRAVAAVAIPMEWPEQQVRVLSTEHPAGSQIQTRRAGDTAEQLLLRLPRLSAGSSAVVVRTFEITRWTQRADPAALSRLSAVPANQVRAYLQPSDGIESTHPEIRRFASEAVGDMSDTLARARALFDATREHVKYVEGPFAGALAGLRTGQGDCEERTCLFIALCRASGIPARLVWGPGHCWSEIALSDSDGKIVWVPADPTKEKEIGRISHFYPIVQKGDRFRVPEFPDRQMRYLTPYCSGVGPKPKIESIEEQESGESESLAKPPARDTRP